MPAKGEQKMVKKMAQHRANKKVQAVTQKRSASSGEASPSVGSDLAAHVVRLARDVEAIKVELSRRPAAGGGVSNEGGARRDQDKVIADRLARLDEKVDAVWNRLADFEERMEGDGTRHKHDADEFEEAPEKDYYER